MNEEQKTEILMLILAIIILIAVSILGSKYNQKEINKCVNAGHSQTFCERNI